MVQRLGGRATLVSILGGCLCGLDSLRDVAGNGGEMVILKGKELANEAGAQEPAAKSGKSRSAVKAKGEKGARTGAKAGGKERPRRVNGNGADLLKKAADRELAKITKKVVNQLSEKALRGDLSTVKTMVSFSEQAKLAEKPKESERTLAFIRELASEPRWVEPTEGDGGTVDSEPWTVDSGQ